MGSDTGSFFQVTIVTIEAQERGRRRFFRVAPELHPRASFPHLVAFQVEVITPDAQCDLLLVGSKYNVEPSSGCFLLRSKNRNIVGKSLSQYFVVAQVLNELLVQIYFCNVEISNEFPAG